MPTFEQTKRGYANLWGRASVRPQKREDALKVARRIISHRDRYAAVQARTGVPWYWIGAVHDREAGGSFAGVLHNGEHIIGTGRKTHLEPPNRGPFSSWEEAAVDALQIKGLHRITEWSMPRMLYEAERFNGQGYFGKGTNSPYLWAATNLQQPGKYVADHVWSTTAWDTQLGVASVLLALFELDPTLKPAAVPIPNTVPETTGAVVTAPVIVGAAITGDPWFMAGAAIAALGLLVASYRDSQGAKAMLNYIITNWITSLLGSGALAATITTLVTSYLQTGKIDPAMLGTAIIGIFTALIGLAAKDQNVTGGTVLNAKNLPGVTDQSKGSVG